MIEVFKTNVDQPGDAALLLRVIHEMFPAYQANFDLQDCDRILRIKSADGAVDPCAVIDLLKAAGFSIAVLTELPEVFEHESLIQNISSN